MDITLFPVGITGLGLDPALETTRPLNGEDNQVSFMEYLTSALNDVAKLQENASWSAVDLVTGDEQFLHNTMIAYDKASMALQLTVEVRNRVIESYQEIMRMQM
jgi:flagellar hook-basal body complex protein FliE